MKKLTLFLTFLFICNISFGQNKVEAEKLVEEGIILHDKGDYEGAIAKYDMALKLDTVNFYALAEKAMTLLYSQKYEEAIQVSHTAIDKHIGIEVLNAVYITLGNAYDGLQKPEKSIEIYDEGLNLYPDSYLLYFNKGITLSGIQKTDDAILCFQKSALLNPYHASSHNAIARLLHMKGLRIPSLLAYCRFLTIEPQSQRANDNLQNLQKIMISNVEKTGKKSVTITIGADLLDDSTAQDRPKENRFTSTDLILSMVAALDYDKKNKKKTEVEQFIRKFETVCASLDETKANNHGFYWEYYVPYFIEMKDRELIETFAYIAFASSDKPYIDKWLKENENKTDAFFEWSESFKWEVD